jgi:formamidopyrimidine-DNA glycosylase
VVDARFVEAGGASEAQKRFTSKAGARDPLPLLPISLGRRLEHFRRVLARHGAGCRVEQVEVRDAGVLRTTSPLPMTRTLRGRRLEQSDRRGKWLFARMEGPVLVFHFGMSGELRCAERGKGAEWHVSMKGWRS